jgi:hypothetical protein
MHGDSVFLLHFQLNGVERIVLSEIELFHEWGNKKSVCVRVGYIEIDVDASARSTRVTSRHSQLVPFTALASDLEALLPLFSNSSRSEANKRCVRSALGCKCSISVTQENDHKSYTVSKELIFSLAKRAGKGGQGNGVMKRFAYLFATRYQPLYQHRLSLLCIVQLLSELLILAEESFSY